MPVASHLKRTTLKFPILLSLTGILCLTAIQATGMTCCLPLATAATVLVFCSRTTVYSTWELLERVYEMRTTGLDSMSSSAEWF